MIVYSKIEDTTLYSKEIPPCIIFSKVVMNEVFSTEVDYSDIREVIRLLENAQPRETEDLKVRLLE